MSIKTSTSYLSLPVADTVLAGKVRVCIASPDISGPIKNGGIGTAYKALAMALVRGGHEVTILYPHGTHSEYGPISHWIEFYATHGIKFVPLTLPAHTTLEGGKAMKLSYAVFDYFRTGTPAYDVIHFPEWLALGYYTICAKRQGLILHNSEIVVGLHSPHLWNMRYNNEPVMDVDILTLDFMERRCAAMADVVVSPSAYMIDWCRQQDWEFPANTYVQPYVLPESNVPASHSRNAQNEITEIVFFGRLDKRKGLQLFCDALDQSAIRDRRDVTVVFLGRSVEINGLNSAEVIRRRSKNWQCPVKLITDFGRDAAVDYLLQPGRLAVIASLADNSPNTVYECLSNGIAFVALRTGGIPEVVAVDDLPHVCCEANSAALAKRLAQAVAHPPAPARAAMDFAANEKIWNQWHAGFAASGASGDKTFSIGAHIAAGSAGGGAVDNPTTHGSNRGSVARMTENCNGGSTEQFPLISICLVQQSSNENTRRAIRSLTAQDYPRMQVILVLKPRGEIKADTLEPEVQNDFTNCSWKIVYSDPTDKQSPYNLAKQCAQGSLLLLMDDSACLFPNAMSLLGRAMMASEADILTCSVSVFNPAAQPDFQATPDRIRLFAGAPMAGLFNNVFGGHAALMTTEAYEALGGFIPATLDAPVIGNRDAWWLFYARAALSAYTMQCVPIPLIQSFLEANAVTLEEAPLDYELADIYRKHIDPKLCSMPLFAQAIKRKADLALPHWQGHGPVRFGLRREIVETIKDIRRKTRRIRYLLKGKSPPRN